MVQQVEKAYLCVCVFMCVCVCLLGAGLSMAVRHDCLYTGLSGFNGALGCMAVGGLCFTLSWRTHLLAVANGDTQAHAHTNKQLRTTVQKSIMSNMVLMKQKKENR